MVIVIRIRLGCDRARCTFESKSRFWLTGVLTANIRSKIQKDHFGSTVPDAHIGAPSNMTFYETNVEAAQDADRGSPFLKAARSCKECNDQSISVGWKKTRGEGYKISP